MTFEPSPGVAAWFTHAAPLLGQAFRETYGLDLKKILDDHEKALGSYRRDVSKLIPRATRVAWTLKKKEIKNYGGYSGRRFSRNNY